MSDKPLRRAPVIRGPLPRFYHQDPNGEDANLCAFYACRHFLGKLDQGTFQLAALKVYMSLGMQVPDAEKMAGEGNDPAIVDRVLAGVATGQDRILPHTFNDKSRILIALTKRAHFITCLLVPGRGWYDYDSLFLNPWEIPNIALFLIDNPGHRYWVA